MNNIPVYDTDAVMTALKLLVEDFRDKAAHNPVALYPQHLFALAAMLDAFDWQNEAEEVNRFIANHVRTHA